MLWTSLPLGATPRLLGSDLIVVLLQLLMTQLGIFAKPCHCLGQMSSTYPPSTVFPADIMTCFDGALCPNIEPGKKFPGGISALRHTFASFLIQNGASATSFRDQLGHRTIDITVYTYSHLVYGGNEQHVDKLDEGRGGMETFGDFPTFSGTGENPQYAGNKKGSVQFDFPVRSYRFAYVCLTNMHNPRQDGCTAFQKCSKVR